MLFSLPAAIGYLQTAELPNTVIFSLPGGIPAAPGLQRADCRSASQAVLWREAPSHREAPPCRAAPIGQGIPPLTPSRPYR